MRLYCRAVIGFVSVAIGLAACGGAGDGQTTVDGTIKVQLTRISAPTSEYAVPAMRVTIRDPKGVTRTGVTNPYGIVTFSDSDAPTGLYSISKVTGTDVTGTQFNTPGREFVKASPIANATPWVEYLPDASIYVNASGTHTLYVPVPDIRQVWMVKRESVSAGGNDNPAYASNRVGDFYGRIILSDIHFNADYSDAIDIWSSSGNKFKLYVAEAQNRISNSFNGSASLGDLAENVGAWPYSGPIILEVPSSTDWAFTAPNAAGDATKSQNGNAAHNFGQLAGGLSTILDIYNNGVLHSPAGVNVLTYEIHRFDPTY